jgi:CRP-like cAMP-binding protein
LTPSATFGRELAGTAVTNELLAHLPDDEWEMLRPAARIVSLGHAAVLFADGEPSHVTYFPLSCIISMITVMANGDECEYGCIGREGMLGLQIALGAQPLRGQAICQLIGKAIQFDGDLIHNLTVSNRAPELHRLLLRYAQATINVLAQSAACNALHPISQRAARWMLQSRDRAGDDFFSLTQDFLAKMLGVRRASVSEAAATLQDSKIIEYTRGHIHVLNGAALERASCECYQLMRSEYARVFTS